MNNNNMEYINKTRNGYKSYFKVVVPLGKKRGVEIPNDDGQKILKKLMPQIFYGKIFEPDSLLWSRWNTDLRMFLLGYEMGKVDFLKELNTGEEQ